MHVTCVTFHTIYDDPEVQRHSAKIMRGLIGNAKVFATGNASPLSYVARALVSVVDALASPSSAAVPYACTGGSNGARR